MKNYLLSTALMALLFSAGNAISQTNKFTAANPFFSASKLPYQAPPFDQIKNSDYQPALEEGIQQKLKEIELIANNPAAPTFANTIVAMEKSGQLLTRVNSVFSAVSGANTNPELQKLQEAIAPKIAAKDDAIYLNSKLFKRVETIYKKRAELHLDAESKRLVEYYYQQFQIAGAKLSDADKVTLKKLNEEQALLGAKFTNQLLAATKDGALVVNDAAELQGLSKADLDAFAQNAKNKNLTGKWVLPLKNTTQQPALQSLALHSTRQKLFEASRNRAERNDSNDTRAIIVRIATIRAQKAQLLGFPSFAAWKLQDQMAQTPEAVE